MPNIRLFRYWHATRVTPALAECVREYDDADGSEFALQDLKAKGLAGFAIGSRSRILAESDSFDGAACIEVFEHLFDPLEAACEI